MLNLEKKDFIESTIKDRKNSAFKEFVKISPTLLIRSLSILNYAYMDSEYLVTSDSKIQTYVEAELKRKIGS